MIKPLDFNSSSMLIKKCELTSPLPVPPLTVCLAPLPNKATLQGLSIGNDLSRFKNKVHSLMPLSMT